MKNLLSLFISLTICFSASGCSSYPVNEAETTSDNSSSFTESEELINDVIIVTSSESLGEDVSSEDCIVDSENTSTSPTPTSIPKPVAKSTSTPAPKSASTLDATAPVAVTNTAKTNNKCKICDDTLNSDGSCNTVHNYTGYGHQIYDSSTDCVYVVCNNCGQRWPKSSFSDPWQFSNSHGIACEMAAMRTVCGSTEHTTHPQTTPAPVIPAPTPAPTVVPAPEENSIIPVPVPEPELIDVESGNCEDITNIFD